MKTAQDPRHKKRREIVQELFSESYAPQEKRNPIVAEILLKQNQLDQEIQQAATAWPIDNLNRIDLAILRLAVYELKLGEAPPKVIIDEAVELGKEFGSENSSSFINGVLGTIYKENG